MNKMKKLIAFLLAVCTIVGTLTSLLMVSAGVHVHADPEEEDTEAGETETEETVTVQDAWYYFHQQYGNDNEKLDTMKLYLETGSNANEGLALYALEETGEVAIKNKATGQVMFSNPRDTYLYSKVKEADKAKEDKTFKEMASQLFVEFETIETNAKTTLTSYTDAAMNNQISVSAIKNGVCVEYTLGAGNSRRLIPMRIEKTRYETLILNLITDSNLNKRLSKEGGIYSLKDPNDPKATQAAIDNMMQQYPVIKEKGIAIYVCDEKISNFEKNLIESTVRAYAPMYTFDELEYDHEMTGYVGNNTVQPVFKMALEYKLTNDGFTVRLPASSISFNEDYFRLNSVTILPFMGAGSSEYDGYTLVPDGSGTIIRFEDTLGKNEYRFGSELYGPDNAYHTFSDSYTGKLEVWRYPVFGMVEDFYRYYLNGTETQYCAHANGVKVAAKKDYVALLLDPTLTGTAKAEATAKLEAEFDAAYAESLPSCKGNKDGYELMYCVSCSSFYKGTAIEATHANLQKAPFLSRKATCVTVSLDVSVCQDCGEFQYTYGTALDANAHKYGTADENGHKDCLLCGYHAAATTIKRGEEGKDTYTLDTNSMVKPNCATEGKYTYKYTAPALKNEDGTDKKDAEGNVMREEYDPAQYPDIVITVPATGHTLEVGKASAPSCSGGQQEITCTTCDRIYSMINYDLTEQIREYIDFNDSNNTIVYQNKYGKSYFCKEVKTPTGEVDENGKEITVTEYVPVDGLIAFEVNDKVQLITLKGMHKYVLITDLQLVDGKVVRSYKGVCTDCGHVNTTFDVELAEDENGNAITVDADFKNTVTYNSDDEKASPVEHTDKIKAEIEAGTVVETGKVVSDLYLMKINETKVVSKSPKHRYTDIKKFTVNSSCKDGIEGVKVERCAGCGHIRVTTSDKHEWDTNTKVIIYPATENTVGMQRITCKACQAEKYEEIAKVESVESVLLPAIKLEGFNNEQVTGKVVITDFAEFAGREGELVYTSSNINIVKVEAGGVLTAVASGTTRVNVELVGEDGSVWSGYCNVTVSLKEDTSGVKKPVQPEGTYKKEDPRGFVAIITEGESLCTVTSIHGGKLHKFNSISLTVTPRPSDEFELTGALTATNNDAKFKVVSDRKYTGSYRIQYYMLSNQESSEFEASYSGMAKAYRKYLEKDSGQLTKLEKSEQLPLYLETLGSVVVADTFLSVPITKDAALTSFSNLTTINKELNEAGIKNIHYRLTGYVNGGMTPTMPYDISYQEVLGGNSGYKNFVENATESGASVYTDYDFAYMHKDEWFDGYSDGDHAVKAIDNRYIVKKTYNPTYQAFTSTGLLAVSPSVYEYFYDHFRTQDAKLGSTGISVSTLGTDLNSDFDKSEPYNREDSKLFTQQVLEKMEQDYNGNVMTDGGNSYVLPYAKHILNMSLLGSERMATSASVPFLSMVLHGAINYAGKPTNMASNMNEEILRIIENGAAPYFVLAYQNQSALKESALLSKYYAVSYSHWKDEIIAVYNELNEVLGGLQNASYNSHDYINTERIPGLVEYNNEKAEVLKAINDLYTALNDANTALINAEALVARYVATIEGIVEFNGEEMTKTEAALAMGAVVTTLSEELSAARTKYNAAAIVLDRYNELTAKIEETAGNIERLKGELEKIPAEKVEDREKASAYIAKLEADVAQYTEERDALGASTEIEANVATTKAAFDVATKNYNEAVAEMNELTSELSTEATALNRYKENVVAKKEALNVAMTNLNNKLVEYAELFDVTDADVQKVLNDTKITLATVTDLASFKEIAKLFAEDKYVGYGSFDKDGNYTPRAKDFIGEDGEYNETRYTMSDNSVVRCGWDKNGDGKTDVVILINYNTFDVCAYEDGKPVVLSAMDYVVLERK